MTSSRYERALSMVELLISLGVLAIAMGSVLAMFVGGARLSGTARARTEAARVARTVIDLLGDEKLVAGELYSQDVSSDGVPTNQQGRLWPNAIPPYQESDYEWVSAVALVWRCTIEPHSDGNGLYLVTVEVRRDAQYHSDTHTPHPVGYTGNCCKFDDADEPVGVWTTILADREP